MRAKVTIQRNRIRELSKQGAAAAARRNKEVAEDAKVIAQQLVPVKSGALKATIRVEENARTGGANVIAGNETVDYASHVEFGTVNADAQPFLRPAAELAAKRSRTRTVRAYK